MTLRTVACTLSLAALAGGAAADEIQLHSGGTLVGDVVRSDDSSITVELDGGHVVVLRSSVRLVVPTRTPLAAYRRRAARLAPEDVEGWLELGEWARTRRLSNASDEAMRRVLDVDPGNAPAHQALGHMLVGERWLPPDEAYPALGFVFFEGRWMRPEERESIEREREERAEQERLAEERAQAEARLHEAELRVAAAEARARQAAADAAAALAAAAEERASHEREREERRHHHEEHQRGRQQPCVVNGRRTLCWVVR